MPKIIVDCRESRSGLAQLLAARGAEVVTEELESADYVLAEGLGIERKTATDFILSILDRRLFCQVPVLKQAYARPFILVEGDLFRTRSDITPDALLGALSYLSVLQGVPVLTTAHTEQTADLMLTMQRHALEGLGYEIALRGGKPKSREPQAQYLVEGLPGIGPTAARKLLTHLGSAQAVFTAPPDVLRSVPGIGPKTVAALREVLEFDMRR